MESSGFYRLSSKVISLSLPPWRKTPQSLSPQKVYLQSFFRYFQWGPFSSKNADLVGNARYTGYCIEILSAVAESMNFTYVVFIFYIEMYFLLVTSVILSWSFLRMCNYK